MLGGARTATATQCCDDEVIVTLNDFTIYNPVPYIIIEEGLLKGPLL